MEMIKFVRRARNRNDFRGDPAYIYSMCRGMLTIDGVEVDLDQAFEFVRALPGADTLVLRDAIDDHDVGPELEIDFTCEKCGHYWFNKLPMDADFFRPGVAKRRRASRSTL